MVSEIRISQIGVKMGSEGKSKKRRSSPSSDEEERRRKHRKRKEREEKEEKSRKRKDKEGDKKRDKKSSRKSEDKEKRSKDKHKHKKKIDFDFKEISQDDYFSKSNEFATWLKEEKNIYFSDLSSESAHDLFSRFTKQWNKGKLELRYYEGISAGPRTAHNWKIKSDKEW